MKSLTKDNKDEEQGGHSRCDVKHNSDVMSQHVDVVHVRHQNGRHEETNGDTQLQDNKHLFTCKFAFSPLFPYITALLVTYINTL